jgi:hypothetical protein
MTECTPKGGVAKLNLLPVGELAVTTLVSIQEAKVNIPWMGKEMPTGDQGQRISRLQPPQPLKISALCQNREEQP